MQKILPFLISIPHGGTRTPVELKASSIITPHDLLDDSDSFTREIYDVGDLVVNVTKADVARAFVDMSRAPHQLPPAVPDGLIKSSTCLGKPIYAAGQHPDTAMQSRLITRYYEPYHQELKRWSAEPHIKLALDCHSMLPVGPLISPDAGQRRPLVNLGNVNGKACSDEIVTILAACFADVFKISSNEITVNQPFKGGYITRTYAHHPIPWIQIELNRILYLDDRWFDRAALRMDHSRLNQLNALFADVLVEFYENLERSKLLS